MPLRSDWTTDRCPIARSLEVLGDPWALLVLRQAFCGVRRFDHFRDQLAVADTVLSDRLARLTAAQLLERVPYADGRRTRHEYVLTEAGADTLPILLGLAQWGERHRPHPDPGVRMDILHRSCGQLTTSVDRCSHCGEALSPTTTSWRKSWQAPALTDLTGSPT